MAWNFKVKSVGNVQMEKSQKSTYLHMCSLFTANDAVSSSDYNE